MHKLIAFSLLAPLVAGGVAWSAGSDEAQTLSARDAMRMENLLGGKTPGEAVSCLPLSHRVHSSIIGDSTILYEIGRTVYRNDIPGGCPGLNPDYTISTVSPSSRLCSGQIVRVSHPTSGFEMGSCTLGQFVPYRRVAQR